MKIDIEWREPLVLKEDVNLIYSENVLEEILEEAGVYVFARRYGETITPLYVGQAGNLHSRIKTQLNNVKLMKKIQNWEKNGKRILCIGYVKRHGAAEISKVLNIVESALIEHGLAEGHPLVNIQGTKKPVHTLNFKGSRLAEQIAPREMFIKV